MRRSPFGRQLRQLRLQPALLVEEFLRPIAPQPVFRAASRCSGCVAGSESGTWCDRKVPSTCMPSTTFGPVQPFGELSTIIGQRGRSMLPCDARVVLDSLDLLDRRVERRGHRLVHRRGLVTLDEVGRPAVAAQQLLQFLARDARQQRRVGDLVAVEMQDRQHRAVGHRIEKLVRMPCRGERTGLRFAVADDAGDDEIGIVEHRAERVAERIAQLAALMDRARALRRRVARNPAGKRKLREELPQPRLVLADIGIDLAVRALQISVAHDRRPAVSRTGNVNHVQIVFLDDPVQVHVNEILPGRGAPVPQQHVFHIGERQRPPQQGIVIQIDLPNREIVRRPPVRVHAVQQFRSECPCHRVRHLIPMLAIRNSS